MAEPTFNAFIYPPLGKNTIIPARSLVQNTVHFDAVFEVCSGGPISDDVQFEVILWWRPFAPGHSIVTMNGQVWRPSKFIMRKRQVDDFAFVTPGPPGSTRRLDAFELDVKLPLRPDCFLELREDVDRFMGIDFCLKYRFGDGPWLWNGRRTGGRDGRVVVQSVFPRAFVDVGRRYFRKEAITNFYNKPQVIKHDSKSVIFRITTDTNAATEQAGATMRLVTFSKVSQWMAISKIAAPWMGPQWSSSPVVDLEGRDTMMLLVQQDDGNHICIVVVSGQKSKFDPGKTVGTRYLFSDNAFPNEVFVRAFADGTAEVSEVEVLVYMGVGIDPITLVSDLMRFVGTDPQVQQNTAPDVVQQAKQDRFWTQGLSYCTWNGLGWDLSSEKIKNVLDGLASKGIKIANLVVDDNWQTLSGRSYGSAGTWSDFEANEKFPGGLKEMVRATKSSFPWIQNIGVWHALHGYWDGITPGSKLAQSYDTIQAEWMDNVNQVKKNLTFISPKDIGRFYMDFYKYLSESGITCVKTDVQSRIDELEHVAEKGPLYPAYQQALLKASEKYLEGRTIYCMSHIPRIIFPHLSSHMAASTSPNPPIMRTSDDFYPTNPDTHPYHIFSNSMNGLFLSSAYCLQDWDMFQTHDGGYSLLHAFGRALSGGPVFITDAPGQTDAHIINSLCAPTPRSAALHTISIDKRSHPRNPYHRFGEETIFEIEAATNDGLGKVVGIVNLCKMAVENLLPSETFLPQTRIPEEYRLFSYKHGFLATPRPGTLDYLLVHLQPNEWDIITALRFSICTAGVRSATVVGYTDKLLPSASLKKVRYDWEMAAQAVLVSCSVDFLGQLRIYTEGFEAKGVTVDISGTKVQQDYVSVEHAGGPNQQWVVVDLVKFWEEGDFWEKPEEVERWTAGKEEVEVMVRISW
ncbi:glycoside hydrolase [Ascobolus immersus RN42]|uniref:Glycoside hydrolase n=1 Tax=Ascobolus immersus RN42 TaxID=1160509 RepID=A0A3N4HYT2_ASCIM|nr:glycoside hydrolase [Ascobolus immersus RN42]